MGLPSAVRVEKLEVYHEDYHYYKNTWDTISDLREGATAIVKKAAHYLPPRPGEQSDIYALRLQKISYTPVMATAIREFTAKLSSSPVYLSGTNEDDFWEAFRDATDGKNKDEVELLTQIFSCLLYFGRVYVAVDRPKLGLQPRSAFEDAELPNQPYAAVYEPLNVINWGENWYISRQIVTANKPLEEPVKLGRWTVWTDEVIAVYEAPIRLDKDQSTVVEIKVDGHWRSINDPRALVPGELTLHELGQCPMVSLTLPHEMWTGNNVYLKQLQHFRIESSWTDAGIMAGTIQRVFTPLPPPPADDPRVVFEEPDYSQIQADNAHVLVGADFKFQESSGSAIASLTSQLETIERQIKALVSMSFSSVSKGAVEQSGASKEVDMALLQDSMRAYGTKVAQLYQDVLRLVALSSSKSDEIAVSGLDEYGVNTLSDMLDNAEKLEPIAQNIPPTALKLWYGKLANLLAGSRSAEMDQAIAKELEEIFKPEQEDPEDATEALDPEDPANLDALIAAFGVSPEEARYILNGA